MSSKPKCPYWNKCYRKNPKHSEEFAHPSDDSPGPAAIKAPAAAAAKPKLTKPSPAAAAAAADAMVDAPAAESVAGKKRGRADSEDSKKVAAAPAPAAAAAAAASSSSSSAAPAAASSAVANPAADTVFALEDRAIDAATQALWTEFHGCCFADSCPVHSSPSSPGLLFTLGAPLLRGLYGGLEFAPDLFLLAQFAVQTYMQQGGATSCDIKFEAEAVKNALAAAAANAAAATNGADGADGSSSSSSAAAASPAAAASSSSASTGCAWRAACAEIRRVFVPLLSLELAGPLRILLGEFAAQPPASVHPFLLDRFFYDSPEVWTFLVSTAQGTKDAPPVHYAYYRDDPRPEHPAAFVASLTAESPVVTPVGNSALMALMFAIDAAMDATGVVRSSGGKKAKAGEGADAASSAATGSMTLESLRSDLDAFGKSAGFPLTVKGGKRPVVKRDPAWTKREKKVVCDLDNVVGLVVPYEDDIGWRPVNCENAELAKIVRDIEAAKYSGKKINFDALDHLVTLTAYANDERDPGMGIELALNLFAKSLTNAINSDICRLLNMGYGLVDRHLYSSVIEEFMRHRGKKGARPVHKWIQKE